MKENILIIDDDVSILLALKEILEEYGYAVDTVEDEETALEKISLKEYDIAIVDMVLKETNGLDLIGKMQERFPNVVIVALTGFPPQEYVAKSFRKGAVEFLTKPCEKEELVEAICRGLVQKETKKKSQKMINTSFPWEKIIRDNPACVDTILSVARRKVNKEIFRRVKRCERNFECLFSDDPDVCIGERYVGENTCFIKTEGKKNCSSRNQFSFGFTCFCSCPIRGELFNKKII